MGASYGTAKSGSAIAAMAVFHPQLVMTSLLPVIMSGILGIYGLVVAIFIAGSLDANKPYPLFVYS